jgi:hypothetical protein
MIKYQIILISIRFYQYLVLSYMHTHQICIIHILMAIKSITRYVYKFRFRSRSDWN